MSRHLSRWALLAAVLVLGARPSAATAQHMEQERALVRHLDSIAPLLAQADSAATLVKTRRAEAERRRSAPVTDTFTVGPLRIVTLPSQRALAEKLFHTVWDREYASFVSRSPALAKYTFVFEWTTPIKPIYVVGAVRNLQFNAWRPRSAVVNGIRQAVSTSIVGDLAGTKVGAWALAPIGPTSDGATIYRAMAGAPMRVDHACLAGDTHACWAALSLGIGPASFDRWYSPDQRRALVTRMRFLARLPRTPERMEALWKACVQDGVQASCDAFLTFGQVRGVRTWTDPLPMNSAHNARGEMVWLAVKAGGAGAWERLREHPEMSAGDALAYASGLTKDQLASRWRRWLESQRPAARADFGSSLFFTLLWVAVCAGIATRSTRWRLG